MVDNAFELCISHANESQLQQDNVNMYTTYVTDANKQWARFTCLDASFCGFLSCFDVVFLPFSRMHGIHCSGNNNGERK